MTAKSRRSFLKKVGLTSAIGAGVFNTFGEGFQQALTKQNLASSPSDLKITKITSAYFTPDQRKMFVKIETNQGITGYGEGVDAVGGTHYLVKQLGAKLVGKSPLNVNRLFEDLRRIAPLSPFTGSQAGIFIAVLSAIDIALWDVAGKALALPVYQLLGGKFRDAVHMYTHPVDNSGTPENIAASCLAAKNAGYDAVKFWVDIASFENDPNKQDVYNPTANNKEIDRIVKTVAAVRQAIGPAMAMMVEMHTRFDLPTAIRLVKAFELFDPTWIEEPVPPENMDALREVTQSSSTPICVGENLYMVHQFQQLLDRKAADIIMPDVQKCGGIGEAQRIANLAYAHYVPFAPHMVGTPFAMMASAHVCASIPNFFMLESNQKTVSDWEGIVADPPAIKNSFLKVSDKPGIGLEIVEDGLRKYATAGMPFFE
jgi:galactonate dehydratase